MSFSYGELQKNRKYVIHVQMKYFFTHAVSWRGECDLIRRVQYYNRKKRRTREQIIINREISALCVTLFDDKFSNNYCVVYNF